MPAARAMAGKWIAWLVEPPVASRPTSALTIAFSSTTWASGRSPSRPSSARRCTAARVSAWRSGVPGLTKAAFGHVQPHQLHHHLVGVGGAVEGAGAGRSGRSGSRPAAARPCRLALGIELANALLLLVGRPDGIGPPGTNSTGRWPKRSAPISRPGHDLVADAEQSRGVEHAVAERDRGRQRDHVAAEQRQVHARLALGDAVAHRRSAARDLRGRADLAREDLHLLRVAAVGLMRREHVVVGGDDADVRPARAC